jgi:hypothetical protein
MPFPFLASLKSSSTTAVTSLEAQKKTLHFPQNLENKGLEFFVPSRSMVLKVVRGEILETLELRGLSAQEKLQLPRKIQKTNDPNFAASGGWGQNLGNMRVTAIRAVRSSILRTADVTSDCQRSHIIL